MGDVLVLDPMCMHSASPNAGAIPARHVVRPKPLEPARICCRLPSAFLLHFPLLALGLGNSSADRRPWRVRGQLFTTMFAEAAAGVTLSALTNRMAVAPASKFSEELRAALPEGLRGMLDWELPPAQQQEEEEEEAPGPKL